MGLFKKTQAITAPAGQMPENFSALGEVALAHITDGVMLINANGVVKFANPAAATMAGYGSPTNVVGLDYNLILKLETTEGAAVAPEQSKLAHAIRTNEPMTTRDYLLISAQSERRAAISLTLTPTGGAGSDKIITFRDITKELEKESKQSEFISTASHEMRTPVASIEGYLGLALNPQTATIDDRARKYLEEAHTASQHLGHLFKDLLDVTKLDDRRMKIHLVPIEIVSVVREIAGARMKEMAAKHLKYSFGTADVVNEPRKLDPLVYAAVDLDFLREILDNLIENAIKYTPEGGEIWVNCRGDGDKVLINVTDTGIGVSPEDAGHIFQKFYRVDNSQTRSIGGTGLGLYIVRQRVEAMGGRVWVESAFGDGSTFFVSLPRLSDADYQRRLVAYQNEQAVQAFAQPVVTGGRVVTMPGVEHAAAGAGAAQPGVVPVATQPAEPEAPMLVPEHPAVVAPAAPAVPNAMVQMHAQPAPVQVTPAPVPPAPVAPPVPVPATQPAVAQPVVATPVPQPDQPIPAPTPQPVAAQPAPISDAIVQNPQFNNQKETYE